MSQPMLVETLGEAPHSLMVLSFFLERPLYPYRAAAIAQVLKLQLEEVNSALIYYIRKEYIFKSGRGYELDRSNNVVRALMKCVELLGDAYYNEHIAPSVTAPHYYKKYPPENTKMTECVVCGKVREHPIHKNRRKFYGKADIRNAGMGTDKS